jgi:hypothetical protein
MVAVPLATRTLLRSLGRVPMTSPILDTFPTIAEYLLPRVGFLLLVPLGLAVYNLRIEGDGLTRAALWGFLVAHAGAFAWGLGVLAGLWSPVLPGGP